MKKISKPNYNEFALYYEEYIESIDPRVSVLEQLKKNAKDNLTLFKTLSEDLLQSAYAEGKWSIKDIIMHLIDTERVFVYRAMRFVRLDKSPQPFFDENEFVKNACANAISTKNLLKEYAACRSFTLSFFNNLNASQLKQNGIASNFPMSVRACAWIICGHEMHHLKVIKERYLK